MKIKLWLVCLGVCIGFISCSKNPTKDLPKTDLKVNPASISLSGNIGSVDSFTIQTKEGWNIDVDPWGTNWFDLSARFGTGNSTVYLTITGNNVTGSLRSAILKVIPDGYHMKPPQIQLTQGIYDFQFRTQWSNLFGGSNDESFYAVTKANDGGYLFAGSSASNNGDLTGNHGDQDFWVMKADGAGNKLWQKNFGGSAYDRAYSITQTTDGGYALTGTSQSMDADVTGNHGSGDVWVVKLDATGNIVWEKTFGGSNTDYGSAISKTVDGGYLVLANTMSENGDVSSLHGHTFDIWLVKLDGNGNIEWENTYGGTGIDIGYSLLELAGGYFLVAGYAQSNDGDVTSNHGGQDAWVMQVGLDGIVVWQKTYGGVADDAATSITDAHDGGFAFAGNTLSNDGDVSGNHGDSDFWVVKIDGSGNKVWQRTLGGNKAEYCNSVITSVDRSFLIAGNTLSSNGDITGYKGNQDTWLVKLNGLGDLIWQKVLGGAGADNALMAIPNSDNSFLFVGSSQSNDEDVNSNHGLEDAWAMLFKD